MLQLVRCFIAFTMLMTAPFYCAASLQEADTDFTSQIMPNGYLANYPDALDQLYYSSSKLYWQDSVNALQAADELTRIISEFAIARLDPRFWQWEAWLLSAELNAEQRDRVLTEAFLTLNKFWRRQQEVTPDAAARMDFERTDLYPDSVDIDTLSVANQLDHLQNVVSGLRPWHASYKELRSSLTRLAQNTSSWPQLTNKKYLRPGDVGTELAEMQSILFALGDLTEQLDMQGIYEPQLVEAVKRFQRRHGLREDGIIGPQTRRWLNVTPAQRQALLVRNSIRQSLNARQAGERYILVNIPGYWMQVVEQGKSVLESRVIVGRNRRPTPLLSSEINNVVLNPNWNVPRKILTKDLLPKIFADPNYLTEHHYQLIDYQGGIVDPTTLDWSELSVHHFPYRLRQTPGKHNALGLFKFYLPNKHAVYLHDTSTPQLFNKEQRNFSSGCIRVDEAELLAKTLLNRNGSTSKLFEKAKESGVTKWLPLREPIKVHLSYWTSWVDQQGLLQFRDDIYNFDQDLNQLSGVN